MQPPPVGPPSAAVPVVVIDRGSSEDNITRCTAHAYITGTPGATDHTLVCRHVSDGRTERLARQARSGGGLDGTKKRKKKPVNFVSFARKRRKNKRENADNASPKNRVCPCGGFGIFALGRSQPDGNHVQFGKAEKKLSVPKPYNFSPLPQVEMYSQTHCQPNKHRFTYLAFSRLYTASYLFQ